jgi:integral membrane protein
MNFKTILSQFRAIAILEGISYLMLGITMVLKYGFKMGLPNKIVGYAHGLLFILYLVWLYLNFIERKWSLGKVFLLFLASIVPFGTFWADKSILSKETGNKQSI